MNIKLSQHKININLAILLIMSLFLLFYIFHAEKAFAFELRPDCVTQSGTSPTVYTITPTQGKTSFVTNEQMYFTVDSIAYGYGCAWPTVSLTATPSWGSLVQLIGPASGGATQGNLDLPAQTASFVAPSTAGNYSITFNGCGTWYTQGCANWQASTFYFTVTAPQAPGQSIDVRPATQTITAGQSATMYYSTTNANWVTVSGTNWSGNSIAICNSGECSFSTGSLTSQGTHTYTFTAYGSTTPVTKTVTVTVNQPSSLAPTLTSFTSNNYYPYIGSVYTLSYRMSNADFGVMYKYVNGAFVSSGDSSCSGCYYLNPPNNDVAYVAGSSSVYQYTVYPCSNTWRDPQTGSVCNTASGGNVYIRPQSAPQSRSVDLKVNGSDGPVTVTAGSNVDLSWTSSGTAICDTAWNGYAQTLATSGSQSYGPVNAQKTFSIACYRTTSGQDPVYDNVTVNVTAVPSGFTFRYNGASCSGSDLVYNFSWGTLSSAAAYMFISRDQGLSDFVYLPTLSYGYPGGRFPNIFSTNNSADFEAVGVNGNTYTWANPIAGNGATVVTTSFNKPGLRVPKSSLNCAQPPTVTLWADNTTINPGQSTTIHWTTTNATSATLNGTSVAVNGSQSTGALSSTTTYTLVATGAGGTAQQSITINVQNIASFNAIFIAKSINISRSSTLNISQDSNAISNPPPGFADLSAPIFKEVAP